MGLFDRILGGADKVHDAATDLESAIFSDHRFNAAERLAESGEANAALVTGIRGRYQDTTELVFRLEWDDGTPRDGAVLFGGNAPAALRLGSLVLVATDGDAVVLDVARMASVASAPDDPGRKHRSVPKPGVDDQAQDMRVLSHLKKWTPARGTVESWTRTTTMGMTTDNWDIVVQGADGSTATIGRAEVPTYARWFVFPGSEVPIVVDPRNPAKVQIDWPKLAMERAGGSWQDVPPDGSIAADRLVSPGGPAAEAASFGGEVDLAVSEDSAAAIEGVTIEQWALIEASLTQDRVAPGDYDAYATANFGVPTGRWTEIVAAWNARIRGDWKIGARFGEAYETAQQQLKAAKKQAKK